MKSILIVKTSAIGDVIHTFPVLEYLRNKFPEAQIDWVVEKGIQPLLKAHPLLTNVITIDSKSWRKNPFSKKTIAEFRLLLSQLRKTSYDVLFDLQGNTKSAIVTAIAKAETKVGFGWKSVREKTNLLVTHVKQDVAVDGNIRLKYLRLVQGYFDECAAFEQKQGQFILNSEEEKRLEQILSAPLFKQRPVLMVAFGSKWPNKQLAPSVLQPFLQEVVNRTPFALMMIYGNDQEKQVAGDLVERLSERALAVGDLSLPLWQALMTRVQGVIAVDSAALHLCGTTQTPSFSIFGPSLAEVYKPMEKRHVAFQSACPYQVQFSKYCPKLRTCPTGACMKEIRVEELILAFENWIRARAGARAGARWD